MKRIEFTVPRGICWQVRIVLDVSFDDAYFIEESEKVEFINATWFITFLATKILICSWHIPHL